MNKTIAFLAISAALLLLCVSCSSGGDESNPNYSGSHGAQAAEGGSAYNYSQPI